MKKIICLIMCIAMAVSLMACGKNEEVNSSQVIKKPVSSKIESSKDESSKIESSDVKSEKITSSVELGDNFCITIDGVKLTPGDEFTDETLSLEHTLYTVPSCAFEGEDKLYSFSDFEVQCFEDSFMEADRIFSIYILEPTLSTDEGIALGDSLEDIEKVYGTDYVNEDNVYTYYLGNTYLSFGIENGAVVTIEYALVLD